MLSAKTEILNQQTKLNNMTDKKNKFLIEILDLIK